LPPPYVDLVPKLRTDLSYPQYDIFAGEQLVGVIHRNVPTATSEIWFWAINTVMVDSTVGAAMKGYNRGLDSAKADFRQAFDVWLAWAIAMPKWDLKRPRIDKNLKAIGVAV